MFPNTPAQPCESGWRTNPYPQGAGTHITSAANHAANTSLAPAPRNIKASSGWLWQDKFALRTIAEAFSGDRLRCARSIYLALTEIASNQFTPSRAHTSCAYLGSLAGCSESSARRYLREFVQLNLIIVEYGIHAANTYILLGEVQEDTLADIEMPLAAGGGRSSSRSDGGTQKGVTPDSRMTAGRVPHQATAPAPQEGIGTPAYRQASTAGPRRPTTRDVANDTSGMVAAPLAGKKGRTRAITRNTPKSTGGDRGSSVAGVRAGSGDTPRGGATGRIVQPRAVTADSQIVRIQDSRIQNQQSGRVVGAAPARADIRAENSVSSQPDAMLGIAPGEPTLSNEQAASAQALTSIGVRRTVAFEIATTYSPDQVRGWVRYALRAAGLKSKAGFVLAMLHQGEEPPAPFPHYQPVGYSTSSTLALTSSLTSADASNPPVLPAPADDKTGEDAQEEALVGELVGDAHHSSPSSAQLEPSWGLIAASLHEDSRLSGKEPATREETFASVPDGYALALWQAVREELRRRVSGSVWSLWLQYVRLIAADGLGWRLSRPAVGVAETFERRYSADIADALTGLLGREVSIEWVHGTPL